MSPLIRKSVLVAGAALLLTALAPAASAQSGSARSTRAVTVDRLSLRLAADPRQVANVQGGATANGTPVIQYPWTGQPNERWEATPTGGGYYRFTSFASGKCLNVQGGGTADGTPVIIYTCGGYDNEQWKLVPKGIGYQIVAKSSGKCLNVRGAVGVGNALVQYTCTADGAPNDVWLPVWEPAD
ncbi:RICIN domain-containing protein [Kitasatospora sp. NPDC059571]|uniref:RICIN domain-containing protein n=1 Tax=Kitasatospora sp. NPDC059571 TaxID=3346871 RepID=UPI0036A19D21